MVIFSEKCALNTGSLYLCARLEVHWCMICVFTDFLIVVCKVLVNVLVKKLSDFMETAKSRDFLWGFAVSRIKLVIAVV